MSLNQAVNVIWTAPDGSSFVLKTLESGYSQKHIGEVKENPRTSYSRSTSTKGGGGKKGVVGSNDTFTDLGVGGKDISLDCYFIGDKHHLEAEEFRNALCQVGKSKLQLAYGEEFTVNVLSFEVKNSLVQKVNSTVITVNWHETSPSTYPKSETSKQKEIKNLTSSVKEGIATSLEATAKAITSPSRLAVFSANFQRILGKISTALDVANNITLNSIMTDILGQNLMSNTFTITSQIGVIFSKAALFVNKAKNLTNGAFTLPEGYNSLFGGWQSLISSLKTNTFHSSSTGGAASLTPEAIDELKLNDMIANSAIVSVAEALLNTEFETRSEAVEGAEKLIELNDDWNNFVNEQQTKITELEDAYIRDGNVDDIVSKSANEIIERSYKLKVEQKIILTESETPIQLAYKYYNEDFRNNPDKTVEYLIRTNKFSDEEFFLIPRGTEVKIYV